MKTSAITPSPLVAICAIWMGGLYLKKLLRLHKSTGAKLAGRVPLNAVFGTLVSSQMVSTTIAGTTSPMVNLNYTSQPNPRVIQVGN
ncbi:unnamed protein product [Orchesella dallaii]|uniref:Uncharacterized protein n=1 Tax=Orchesella dallaii TaxID=48710 RepID=A0ABP1RH47_9HEXA